MGVIIRNGISYTPSQISTLDELPQNGVSNQLYLVGENSYFWDGENFVQINTVVDGITIIKNQDGELTGVGADLSGKTVTYNNVGHVAGDGATVYNDYVNNKNAGQYSNVFGSSNIDINGEFDTIFGYQNAVNGATVRGNTILGEEISLSAKTIKHNLIVGSGHKINKGNVDFTNNLIFGYAVKSPAGNNPDSGKIRYSIIGGKEQNITNTAADGCVILGLNSSCIECTDGSTILGSGHTVTRGIEGILVAGSSNEVNTSGLDSGAVVIGAHLNVSQYINSGFTVLGKYNDTSVKDSIFTIGNGTDLTRSDAIRLSNTGLLQVCGADGDVVTVTGNTLNTEIKTISVSNYATTTHEFQRLPFNGKEVILKNNNTLVELSHVKIADISYMDYNNGRGDAYMATTNDYNSVIVFKKGSNMTTADNVLDNFTDTNLPKIYLLNPDIDISSFTIIHVMLFNDGVNICAIVAGYKEEAPL